MRGSHESPANQAPSPPIPVLPYRPPIDDARQGGKHDDSPGFFWVGSCFGVFCYVVAMYLIEQPLADLPPIVLCSCIPAALLVSVPGTLALVIAATVRRGNSTYPLAGRPPWTYFVTGIVQSSSTIGLLLVSQRLWPTVNEPATGILFAILTSLVVPAIAPLWLLTKAQTWIVAEQIRSDAASRV